ncbi:hypothetical protein AB0E01_27725 [Nocardia vinacea]|uniref:hypothetical protein n=1 Tax=Nocardia vinacea TaxID=96468 RepID=UPI0033FAB920
MGSTGLWRPGVLALTAALVTACGGASTPTDPYLWLEDLDSPRVQQWVATENARTLGVLEQDPRFAGNLAEATELGKSPDRLPTPTLRDGGVDNFWQDGDHARGIWRTTSVADYESPQPNWNTVLDLDALAAAESKNWVWKGVDCDPVTHKRCLVSLSEGGEDAVTVREFDRTTGRFVPDGFVLPRGKQNAAWVDENTLLVSREWQPGEMTTCGYPYVVKQWRRGQSLTDAVELARGTKADLSTTPMLLDNGNGRRLSLVRRSPSFWEHEVSLVAGSGLVRVALPPKSDVQGFVGNRILVSLRQDWTTDGATFTAGSLVSLDADELTADPTRLRAKPVYVPSASQTLESLLPNAPRGGCSVTSTSQSGDQITSG